MLQGKMLGLQVRSTVSGLGNNTPDLFIRGQHGMSENTAIVIIDGVERPAADLIQVTFFNRLIINHLYKRMAYNMPTFLIYYRLFLT